MEDRLKEGIDHGSDDIAEIVDETKNKASQKAKDISEKGSQFLSNSKQYLRETDPKELGSDLMQLAKRHPVITLAIGTGVGLLFSRSRRKRRH